MNHAERWSGAGARALVDLPSFRAVQGNPRTRRLSRLLFAVVAAVFGSLFIIPWQQTSISGGRVVAYAPLERRQNIEAPIEGRIVSWAVHEGTRVKKGDLVAVISDNDPELVARMRLERSAVENRVEAARARVRSMEDRIISLEVAELEQLRSRTDAERARAALSAAKSEELALKSDHEKVGSDARALIRDAEAAKAIAQGEVANSEAELTRVDVRLARQASQRIMAPRDGTVLKLLAAQGSEMVKGGDPIAVLIPDTEERAVELHVDGNDLPLVAEGRR